MNNKKLILSIFILVALVQLYVPAKMILDREDILKTGKEYKFKTVAVDPNDPFRGKYITLRYEENMTKVKNESDWQRNETIYVTLTTDDEGYASIQSVSKEKPKDNPDFLKTKVSYVTTNGLNKLRVDYPFDRYYMEESKADDAEQTYAESQRNSDKTTYALVCIKDGEAVLKDVLIDGISINEIVRNDREK